MPRTTAPTSRAPRRLLSATLSLLLGLALLPVSWLVLPASPAAAAEIYPATAGGSWEVEGAGFGHGKGLSQWGAQGRALAGQAPHEILAAYYPGTSIGTNGTQSVRVQLTSYAGPTVVFGSAGDPLTVNGQAGTVPGDVNARFRVSIDGSGMHVDAFNGSTWSQVVVNGQTNLGEGPVEITAGAGTWVYDPSLNGAGRKYRGTIRVIKTGPSSLQAVDILPMQHYLYGVVPRESPSGWHTNALQAQAIAARSYAISVFQAGQPWDICDTTQCQVFGGSAVKAAGGAETPQEAASTTTAVNATDGKVVLEPGSSKVAFTQFSASNGGYSVDDPTRSYLEANPDPYSGQAPGDTSSRWTATLTAAKVQEQCPSGGTLQSFEIVSRDGKGPFGGRITKLKVNCTSGSKEVTDTSALAFGMKHRMWKPTGATGTPGPTLARLAGADRYATAAAIATASFTTSDNAILARGDAFADGLAANFLGGVLQAPTLLTGTTSVPQSTLSALDALDVKTIKVLGGDSAVSPAVVTSLQGAGYTVERIAGVDRFETAAKVGQAGAGSIGTSDGGKKTAVLSSGSSFPDALAAGGIVYGMRFPQLLTEQGSLPETTKAMLGTLGIQRVILTGGTAAVSDAVKAAVEALGITVVRIGGATRYETGVMLADRSVSELGFTADHVDIATGEAFPDALTGGSHAGKAKKPIILTAGGSVPDAPCNFLQRSDGITGGHLYGGPSAISDATKAQLEGCLAS